MVLFGRLLTGKGHKGISWGARNVLYLDLGSSYIAVVISYYCCKKVTTDLMAQNTIYSFTVLELRSPKSGTLGQNQSISRAMPEL